MRNFHALAGKWMLQALGWYPPERFTEATLENFNAKLQPKAFDLTKKFLADQIGGILFYGPPGVGKTHLAAAIFNHFVAEWDAQKAPHPQARFVRENDIFARIRATYGDGPHRAGLRETEEGIILSYASAPVLIIDDLCKYSPADPTFRNRIYYELFDKLWNDKTPLILTANIGPDALEAELGSPITDRIRDLCILCAMTGTSQRGKQKGVLNAGARPDV